MAKNGPARKWAASCAGSVRGAQMRTAKTNSAIIASRSTLRGKKTPP